MQWLEATQLYERQKAQQAPEAAAGATAAQTKLAEQQDQQHTCQANADTAATELNSFLASDDGYAARQLLAVSGRHVVIAEENEGGGCGVVYFLDGNGLQQSIEAMGMWMAYAKQDDIPKPKVSPVNAIEVVCLAIRQGAKAHQIMERIHAAVDDIAQQVLKK